MKVKVILGSTRPGRVGERVSKWVLDGFKGRTDIQAELIDLADYDLPHFNEPLPPRANKNRQPADGVTEFLGKVAAADGYIIITPEYNFAIPGVLKDALDFVDYQMHRKPVAIVSYGVYGGTRASEILKLVLNGIKAIVVPESVALTGPQSLLDQDGAFIGDASSPYGPNRILQTTISELAWWIEKLSVNEETVEDKVPANR